MLFSKVLLFFRLSLLRLSLLRLSLLRLSLLKLLFLRLLISCLVLCVGEGAYGQQKLSVGAHYFSGDYDQEVSTSLFFAPIAYTYKQRPWKFKLSTSWVRIDGPGMINSGEVQSGLDSTRDAQESGMGDMRLGVVYQFQKPLPGTVWVDLGLTVKLPTADEDKGLGTGKSDQKIKVDFIKTFAQAIGFASVSYNKRGDTEDVALKDTKAISLGMSQHGERGASWGMFYDFKTMTRSDSDNMQELSVFYAFPLSKQWSFNSYLLCGLNSSSADYGVGLQATHRF